MFRYLYKDKNPLAGLVRRQYMHFKWEEQGYVASLLARTRVNRLKSMPDALNRAYEDVNILEIDEHYEIAKSDHVEQTFKLLNALNKVTLGETDIVLNKRYEDLSKITAIVDPDKFPIFSLIETIDTHELTSIWDYKKREIMPKLQKNLGYLLEIAPSSLEHHAAGDGVFLRTSSQLETIPMGSLLGFVGGISYDTLTDFTNSRSDEPPGDSYLHRFDNTIVDFTQKIPYPFTYGMSLKEYYEVMGLRTDNEKIHIKDVPASFINPYAIGHKINHPPKHSSPNVILLDMHIPRHFFSESFMKFFPYMRATESKDSSMLSRKSKLELKEDHLHAVGIFALRDIQNGEELFMDYIENSLYDVEITPDWLVRPPPLAPEYRKANFEFEFSTLAKLIDQFILQKQLSVYERFKNTVSHDPSKQEFDDQKKLLKENHPKLFKKFLAKFEDDKPAVQEGHFANKIKTNQNKQSPPPPTSP